MKNEAMSIGGAIGSADGRRTPSALDEIEFWTMKARIDGDDQPGEQCSTRLSAHNHGSTGSG
jgi:hypothetical protein